MDDDAPARVTIACSGLEHAHRGYESFARECFDQLRGDSALDLELVKATGATNDHEHTVAAITRESWFAKLAQRRFHQGELVVEQLAFAFSLQPYILRRRPDVVYFSEWYTGVGLNWLRTISRQQHALVLSNGSMAGEGFEPFDRVHQHTRPALEYVLAHGADPRRQILLPVAFDFSAEPKFPSPGEQKDLRNRLGLPQDRMVVISVAALNRWHKRLDYLIEEVARLPEPRPFVLLVGQPERETGGIRKLAQELLGENGHSIRSVPREEVDLLLDAADAFVLASLAEGLPRALVEAMAHGLPCLAHDYSVADYAMGGHGLLADFMREGALAGLLRQIAGARPSPEQARERHRFVYENFSWDRLRGQYIEMLVGAVGRADFSASPLHE